MNETCWVAGMGRRGSRDQTRPDPLMLGVLQVARLALRDLVVLDRSHPRTGVSKFGSGMSVRFVRQ